jgi:hypothetical protein
MHGTPYKRPIVGSGGIVKRSLAMVVWLCEGAIAKTFGLDAATREWRDTVWIDAVGVLNVGE